MASAYWGRGIATLAVQAMVGELAERYDIRRLLAVFKQENCRSRRLLERLGFTLASVQEHVRLEGEPGELLMQLELA